MTASYRLDSSAAALAERFDARSGDDPWAGGEIAPGQFAPVITAGRDAVAGVSRGPQPRRVVPRLWGVSPPPAAMGQGLVATVSNLESPFWIGNLRNHEFRCLIPASAVLLWGKCARAEGPRTPLWVGAADQPLFAMAGVWKDSEIPSFALLTCPANSALRDRGVARMPVILSHDAAACDTWLHRGWDRAAKLAEAYPTAITRIAETP